MHLAQTIFRSLLAGMCLLPLLAESNPVLAAEPTPEAIEFFEKRIRPIFVAHCYECHSVDSKEKGGELLLDARDSVLKGGQSGPALVPGDPEKSLLITAVQHTDKDLKMPPEKKLSDAQIADLIA